MHKQALLFFLLGTAAACVGVEPASAGTVNQAWNLYQDFKSKTCSGSADCYLFLPAVAGTNGSSSVEITNVTCDISIASPQGGVTILELGQGHEPNSFADGEFIAPVSYLGFGGAQTTAQASGAALYVVPAGTQPVVLMEYSPSGAQATLACSISGPYRK